MNAEIVLSNKIRLVNHSDLHEPVKKLIYWCYKYSNYTPEADQIEFQVHELKHELKNSYSNLSLKEVSEAFSLGLKLKYGEWHGLSVLTYTKWLTGYLRAKQEKEKSIPVYKPKQIEEKVDQETVESAYQQNYQATLDYFRKTGKIRDFGNAICKRLGSEGKIVIDPEEWKQLCQEVKDNIEISLKKSVEKVRSIDEHRKIKNEISDLLAGNKKHLIESECLNIYLARYFMSLPKE